MSGASEQSRWNDVLALASSEAGVLRHHLQSLVGPVGPAGLDDLVQETLLATFHAFARHGPEARTRQFLLGVATLIARQHRARRRRRGSLVDRLVAPFLARTTSAEVTGAAQELARLSEVLDGLADPLREAFVLVHVEQHTLAEAAGILGVPVSTLHHRATRAHALVRAALGDADALP
ncbi:MAG: RNA polymerase sigma factor [Myxococcaceae bacterium]|nr:RNA polymerase sigma factor [Myxococcaceae bacterium]